MINCFKSKSSNLLAVDISHTSITLLGITKTANCHTVEWYHRCPLPENTLVGNDIIEPYALAACMQALLKHSPKRWKKAIIAVPDSVIMTKIMQITDDLTSGEVEQYIASEIDNTITHPLEKINYDFAILGPSTKYPELLDVVVVAAKTSCVTQRVNLLTQVGLKVACVGVESYALSKLIQRYDKSILAVLHLGFQQSHLWVVDGEKRMFSHEENIGTAQLLDSVMNQCGLNRHQAQRAMEQSDFASRYGVVLWPMYYQSIVEFCRRALQLYSLTDQAIPLNTLWLVGGLVNCSEMADWIKRTLGLDVLQVNSLLYQDRALQLEQLKPNSDQTCCILPLSLALYLS